MFDSINRMGERRGNRGIHRTDEQILRHPDDVNLLRAIAAGKVIVRPELRMDLRRLTREECLDAGFGTGTVPTLMPRGMRILAAANGELPNPME